MISCIPLCGSFLNGAVVPHIFGKNHGSFGDAFRIGFILCLLSLLMVVAIMIIDIKTEKHDAKVLKRYKREQK